MSSDFIARLIGMVLFVILGVSLGTYLGEAAHSNINIPPFSVEQYAITFGLVGALFGLIITPLISTRPVRALRNLISRLTAQTLVAALIGLIAGLIVAALLSFPFSRLPGALGMIMPFVGVILFGYFGVAIFLMRTNDIFSVLGSIAGRGSALPGGEGVGSLADRTPEYADPLHEHFLHPAEVRNGAYVVPEAPGYSIEMHPSSIAALRFPDGAEWR